MEVSGLAKVIVKVGMSSCGIAAGAGPVYEKLESLLKDRTDVELKKVGCIGLCFHEPLVEIERDGKSELYGEVTPSTVAALLDGSSTVSPILSKTLEEAPENRMMEKQVRIVLRNCGLIDPQKIEVPEKVAKAAAIAKKRGSLAIKTFKNKAELKKWVPQLRAAYNGSFVQNWEYYPLTEREMDFVVSNALILVIPEMLKMIVKDNKVVGFVLPFPDVSRAFQKNKGKLGPIEILRLLAEIKKTDWIDFNGIGILPEAQGFGGNALIYEILIDSVHQNKRYKHGELTQVAETAVQMRKDLLNLGCIFYKNHRVYQKTIA